MSQDLEIPDELSRLADGPSILVRRDGPPRKGARCVVYWMQRAMRIVDNPALDVAIEAGNVLGLPVVVYFSVIPNYPNANLRHYHFMQQGLRDVATDAAERGVGFVVRRPPDNSLEAFLEEVGAALLIGDENRCREPERWRRVLAKRLKLPFWTVDADVVVPSRVFDRSFVLLHHFRPHLKRELPNYLVAPAKIAPLYPWKAQKKLASFSLDSEITEGFTKLDRTVKPVDSFIGGSHEALKRLGQFVREELGGYEENRNHPELRGTSRLSPYLHFGNIGPLTIALAVEGAVRQAGAEEKHPSGAKARVTDARLSRGLKPPPPSGLSSSIARAAADRFLDQLIGWRELSVLFVRHEPNYDNWECAAPWARKTLTEHAGDPRPYRYSLAQMERAETHDELWNAAQREMVLTGWMHNYMRMYWAKKILEWAPDPARAFEWAVTLNDRYELDGRDPNGYAGIAWAIVGRHDRPWFNRPVFGLVRTMTGASTAKKFDAAVYIRQQGE
jgi:deoxyribodipyrimidine photo-lyase